MLDAKFPPFDHKGVEVMEKELRSGMLSAAPEGATEEALISESMCGAVQALRERGVSKKGIARELGWTSRRCASGVVGVGRRRSARVADGCSRRGKGLCAPE